MFVVAEAENMKGTRRKRIQAGDDDEWLMREILAERRQAWAARRQTAGPVDRKRLEVWALQDDERMAFRPIIPGFTEPSSKAAGDDSPRTGGQRGLELLESTEPQTLPRETRKALALWTRYRLACLELTGRGRTGEA
jgi:hypothetical protein